MGTKLISDPAADPLSSHSIKLGSVVLDVAPRGAAVVWDEVENWLRMGMINPGSLKFDFPKDKYDVEGGSPRTVKKRFITAHRGSVDATLQEIDIRSRELALGHNIGVQAGAVAGMNTTLDGAVLAADQTITLTAVTAAMKIGVTLAFYAAAGETINDATFRRIIAINGNDVTLENPVGKDYADLSKVDVVDYFQHVIGGNYLQDYQARVVISCTDDSLQIVQLPLVNITTGYAPDMGDGTKAIMLPVKLEAIGQSVLVNGRKQVVIGYHYEKPSMYIG